ncbi:MAG TPA: InlB B-repeat-containing protein, partial [Methanocorpusculum sp.]|nr:InlB B-repeat-containing protein [Methanocorpusculum sp.]
MMQRMKGTLRPGRKAGVLALAVLLLTCVLMAGAVSAEDKDTVYVSNSEELQDNITDGLATTIILEESFDTDRKITVTRAVTIDGNWKSLSASPNFSDEKGHLINIDGDQEVVLKNITLDSKDKAKGAQAYLKKDTAAEIRFENVVLMNSIGSGLTVNGAKINATNLTVKGSEWQSVDVSLGEGVTSQSSFTLDEASNLEDAYQISSDLTKNTQFGVVDLPDTYTEYQLFGEVGSSGYKNLRKYWSTNSNFVSNLVSDLPDFNVSVTNTSGPVALHTNLTEALTTYVDSGAMVTILKDFKHVYDYQNGPVNRPTITKEITLNLNGKTITAEATEAADNDNRAVGFIMMKDSGSLTVTGNGKIILYGPYMFYAGGLGSLIIESGTFEAEGTIAATNGMNENANIIIKGGSLTSKNSPVVFMPGTEVLQISGNSVLTGPVGIDIKSGFVTISENAQIIATGDDSYAQTQSGNGPVEDSGTAIVLERTSAYKGDLTLTIQDNAAINSNNGAAIRNYIRENDMGTYSGPVITIKDTASISGSIAAIENAHYLEDTSSTIVGAFNLNGGYYKGTEVLKGNPSVSYPDGYSMTTNTDENGYHFVTTVTEPSISEKVTTNSDGTTTVAATSGTITYDAESQTVTMEDTDAGVTLEVTYSKVTEQTEASITGTVNAISTVYDTIDLGDTHAVSLEIQLDTDEPASVIEQLPSVIKSVKKDLVTTALSAKYNNVQVHTLFEALSSNIGGFNGAISDMTITFHISPSAVGTNPNFLVAHFDANGALIDVHTPAVSKDTDGTWRVTITAEKFSGYAPFTGTAKSSGYTSSSSGNMANAYRVLFNDGATTLSVQTDLSSGDKLTKPETPVKDGYTFAGWYKDSACTQAWDFETGIPGDMTL